MCQKQSWFPERDFLWRPRPIPPSFPSASLPGEDVMDPLLEFLEQPNQPENSGVSRMLDVVWATIISRYFEGEVGSCDVPRPIMFEQKSWPVFCEVGGK